MRRLERIEGTRFWIVGSWKDGNPEIIGTGADFYDYLDKVRFFRSVH